jgi:signal transduction histidine kinase
MGYYPHLIRLSLCYRRYYHIKIIGPNPRIASMLRPVDGSSKRTSGFILLFIIIAAAVVLSLVSLTYFQSVSQQIDKTIRDDLRRQARIEAFHVSELLEEKLQVVTTNVRTAAEAPAIKQGELERGGDVVNARQHNTEEMTDRYFWLDESGKTLWSSAFEGNRSEFELYSGFDVSSRPYFVNPAETGKPYLSPVIVSLADKSQRMFIAYPIFGVSENDFKGVIVASLRADNLGSIVKNQLSPEIESSIGIIDANGAIIYTADPSFIGENLFGEKVQSALSPAFSSQSELDEFNDFLRASIQGGTDSKDFTVSDGSTATVTYLPILIKLDSASSSNSNSHFLTLYLTAPHNVANVITPLVDQQRTYSIAVIATIAGIAIAFSYVILSSNKRLERTVSERTASLRIANESLSSTNKDLVERTHELEIANEQLKINDKMQREFINVAAHELRTPTQAIMGYSELFDLRPQDREEAMRAVARNALRLESLTEDILDVTRIEGKALELSKEKFNISDVISTALEDTKSQLRNGNIRFLYQEPRDIMIEGDKRRITQVISNLLNNAVKFTKKGTIFILAEENAAANEVVVTVVDSGTGIDPDIQPRLFTKFATKSQTGTGLGLFISKSIVEAHGGRIAGRNNQEGRGATFSFTLPIKNGSD